MESASYWTRVLKSRLSRRRALAATGAGAAGSFLLACGGDSDDAGGKVAVSDLVSLPVDTSKEAKQGGTLLRRREGDIRNLDPNFLGGDGGSGVHVQMLHLKEGYLGPVTNEYVGESVESWEYSGDKLQVTFKVRPNRTHNIPPVNGRPVDAEDVAASWKAFEINGVVRDNFANAFNPEAPIVSVTAIDRQTVVMKLARPMATLFGLLYTSGGSWMLMPKEAYVTFDPQKQSIGWGPYMLADYNPSVSVTQKRHPGYYDAARFYIDEVRDTIIPEYSAALSQFRAGRIHELPTVRQEDVLQTKREVPELQMYVVDPVSFHGITKFGWNPALNTPFRDKRLRQALAMAIDSDYLLDIFYNLTEFKSQGIPIEGFRYTSVPAWVAGVFAGEYWLNPHDPKKFGPNVKYYQHDVAEAKKLVAAAGYPNGLDTVAHYASSYGGDVYQRYAETAAGYAQEAGIRLRADVSPITGDFRPKFANPQGDFDGLVYRLRPAGGIGDPAEMMFVEFTPAEGVSYTGFFSEDSSWKKGDPRYTELLTKARQEFDEQKRIGLLHDFQRMEAANQYQPSMVGIGNRLGLYWPVVRNVNVLRGVRPFIGLWLDQTRKPLGPG